MAGGNRAPNRGNAGAEQHRLRWPRHLRRGHLKKLAKARYGMRRLPDDVHGRVMLRGLLAAGLTGSEAHRWAPWAGALVDILIIEVDARPSSHWTGERLGNMVELTNAERERLKLWSLWPGDLDKGIIRIEKRGVAKVHNRKRMQSWRKLVQAAKEAKTRPESLLMLIGKNWRSASKLTATIAGGRAWQKPDGSPLTGSTLRKAVHRALDELSAHKLIESRTAKHDFALRRVRRLALPRVAPVAKGVKPVTILQFLG